MVKPLFKTLRLCSKNFKTLYTHQVNRLWATCARSTVCSLFSPNSSWHNCAQKIHAEIIHKNETSRFITNAFQISRSDWIQTLGSNWFLCVQCRFVHHPPSLLIKPNSFPLYFRPSNIPVVPLIFKANKDVFSNNKLDEDLIEPFIVPSFFNKTNNAICLTYLSRFLWKMSTQSQVNTDRLLTCNHFSQCLYYK